MKLEIRYKERFERMSLYEREAIAAGYQYVTGIDEAGRGPLAGPVVAAACILKDAVIFGLDDSKKLSEKRREELFSEITTHALAYSIAFSSPKRIDEINILNATKEAMIECVETLSVPPDYVLIDAVSLKELTVPHQAIIRGDAQSNSIAAASILAKVTRDRIMCDYDKQFPGYGFSKHKGYGTKEHYAALHEIGPSEIHRLSFLKSFFNGSQ
ncbi:MAG: ribonuclease HII [Clostridiaceae bacterium]|nr:ribonuclease HII [Clostridiaceae bacterium]